MQKNRITNKITPCCGLPFSVIYWWISNLTLNSESDRQFILSKISQNGTISIDGWKVLVNSGTLEADASLTKAEFLAWFDCGKQPTCEQLKLIIEGFQVGNFNPNENLAPSWTAINETEENNGILALKITDWVGGVGDLPDDLEALIGKYYKNGGGFTDDISEAQNFFFQNAVSAVVVGSTSAINSIALLNHEATEKYLNGFRAVGNLYNKDGNDLNDKYFFNDGNAIGDLGGWFVSDYIRCFPNMVFTMSSRRYVMFYDINGNFISGNSNVYDMTLTAPTNAYFFRFDWKMSEKTQITILEGNKVQNYVPYLEPKDYRFNDVPYKRIIATRNTDDFNSIREIAEAIAPFSNFYNRYEIFVNNGEWREMDWQGWGDFVKIVGQNMLSTKIICDGLWTDAKYKTDNLFPYEAYRNKTFSQVWNDLGSPRLLHIIFAKKSLYAENLSFEGNNLKYILHCDNPNYEKVYLKNVSFKQRASNYIMGNGINGGQSIILENFIADNDPNPIKTDHAFYHHTWGNQKKGSLLHLINGTFKNGGIALLGEAGSEQQDDVVVESCKGSEMKISWSVPEWTPGNSLWQNPATNQLETNPTNVPYCIYVWDKGTGITENEDNGGFSGYNGEVRPNRGNYLM